MNNKEWAERHKYTINATRVPAHRIRLLKGGARRTGVEPGSYLATVYLGCGDEGPHFVAAVAMRADGEEIGRDLTGPLINGEIPPGTDWDFELPK